MRIYLLSGWSGSGKDTAGTIFQKTYGCIRMAFADVLKTMVAAEFQFPVEWTHTEAGKQRIIPAAGKSVRELLIQRGQEIRKEQEDPGFFARIVATQIQNLLYSGNAPEGVVITDWRLPVEYETLKAYLHFPIVKIRIHRWGQTASPIPDSETETQLDSWTFDFTIHNLGTHLGSLEIELSQKLMQYLRQEKKVINQL
jgi:hypothetical protein